MGLEEIRLEELDAKEFIEAQVAAISEAVGDDVAINALSGGVDSAAVTLLGHRALGERLKTYFVENGLMREGEAQQIVAWFADLGVHVEVVDAQDKFFAALEGVTDPEEKREQGITQVFYKDVFAELVRETGARILFQGTNFTDVEETAAGVKRQHNVFAQIGITTLERRLWRAIEPRTAPPEMRIETIDALTRIGVRSTSRIQDAGSPSWCLGRSTTTFLPRVAWNGMRTAFPIRLIPESR